MATSSPVTSTTSIMLVGQFKPDNFHPEKLIEGRALSRSAGEAVSYISLIPGNLHQYKFGWGEILVQPDRFQVISVEEPHIRACDFVLKVLRDIASNSRVHSFGINRDSHFDFGTIDARNAIGTRLVPPSAWGDWGRRLDQSMRGENKGTKLQPGVMHVQMREPFQDEKIVGYLDVSVGPSIDKPDLNSALFRANYHHQSVKLTHESETWTTIPADESDMLLAELGERFENALTKIDSIFNGIINYDPATG